MCQYVSGHIERRYQADDSHLRIAGRRRQDIPLSSFRIYAPTSGNTSSIEKLKDFNHLAIRCQPFFIFR